MASLSTLSASQRDTLASFQSITATSNPTAALQILTSANWDLQLALTKIYDGDSTSANAGSASGSSSGSGRAANGEGGANGRGIDQFGIDEGEVMPPASGGVGVGGRPGGLMFWVKQILTLPLTLLTLPFAIFPFLFRLFRLPRPPTFRPRNPFTNPLHSHNPNRPPLSASASAARLLLSLNGPGPVPNFLPSGYSDCVRLAKATKRIMVVFLSCEEHEDDEWFRSEVISHPGLVAALNAEECVCWFGDVRDSDAYEVTQTLQAVRYPFVGFLSSLPPDGKVGVVSRLEGMSNLPGGGERVVEELTRVGQRVGSFLARGRAEERAREAERQIRREQDEAVERAGRKDAERVLKRRREVEEAKKAEERRVKEEAERVAREKREKIVRQKMEKWRKWRCELLGEEPKEGIRVAVRLGDGRRVVRRFSPTAPTEHLYAFIECTLSPPPSSLPSQPHPPAFYNHTYEFGLASTFPRQVVENYGTLEEQGVKEGANLVVEGLEKRRVSLGERPESEDEEESEEEAD